MPYGIAANAGPVPASRTVPKNFQDFASQYSGEDIGAGSNAEALGLSRLKDFNAQDYLKTASQGAFNDYRRDLDLGVKQLRGFQAGTGRLDTGFATDDEDKLVTDLGSRLNDRVAALSLQAGQLQLGADQGLLNAGSNITDRGYQLKTAGEDARIAEENAKRQERQNRLKAILGFGGQIGGALIGTLLAPGVGTAAGAGIGKALFQQSGAGGGLG